jgi:hypothetical protein
VQQNGNHLVIKERKPMFTKRQWRNMGFVVIAAVLFSLVELALRSNTIMYSTYNIIAGFMLAILIKTVAWNGIYIFACLLGNFLFQGRTKNKENLIDTAILAIKEEK